MGLNIKGLDKNLAEQIVFDLPGSEHAPNTCVLLALILQIVKS